MMTQQVSPLIPLQPPSGNSIFQGRMENSNTTGEVQTEGENNQMEKPTDVEIRGKNKCKYFIRVK